MRGVQKLWGGGQERSAREYHHPAWEGGVRSLEGGSLGNPPKCPVGTEPAFGCLPHPEVPRPNYSPASKEFSCACLFLRALREGKLDTE